MTEGKTAPLLQVQDLRVAREGHEILRGVDLQVDAGSVHVVLGLNGSGKSTLAYTLMGAGGYTTLGGSILLEGEDITQEPIDARARRGLTLAWQEPARFEGLSVERYLSLGQPEPDRERLLEALEAVNLDRAYLPRYVDEGLSGGERKRVELAAVFAMRPRLAILDEPDSGIDRFTLDDIATLMRRMASEGSAVLLISHRDEVVQIADHASLICGGRIMQTGLPDVICDRYTQYCSPCEQPIVVERGDSYA
ncbi:MAG: ABC transporter ATP-binding protein [Anaerolineae bacterium]|nr:ABC transporter ATP-binding protein [Chloroflexota bacterium]